MSLPKFPDLPDGYTINDSIAQIITSIAMEEIGLSHIINAEGEKLQYVLGTLENAQQRPAPLTIDQVLEVNESVKDMLGQVSFSQMFLLGKMQAALNAYQKEEPMPDPDVAPNIFIVGGTGMPVQFSTPSYSLSFGTPLHVVGSYIEKLPTNVSEFMIMADGKYTIDYQMAVSYETITADMSVYADLVSAHDGILAAIQFPHESNVLRQQSVTVQLAASDIIQVVMRQEGMGDYQQLSVYNQVINFTRIA